MRRTSLGHLVCPHAGAPLALEDSDGSTAQVLEGKLTAGDRSYAIEKGIPHFVPAAVANDQTVKSFGQKWDKHRYYREHTREFYTNWYVQRYDLGDVDGLRDMLKGVEFALDAGTGAGRDATNFAEYSDALVFGIDTAWDALAQQADNGTGDNHELVHADINKLPFRDEFFDFINCDQVIHHTPDPPATFQNLRRKLKRGGTGCFYVYKKKSVIREFVDDYIRERIKDMSIDEALEVCEAITKLGKAFSDLKTTVTIEQDIDILDIQKGTYDVQRFLHWNVMKCFWNDDFDFFTNNIVNVDWYHPVYCFRYTPEEFRAWFDEGWEILSWDVQDAGISCRARKTG
jgi:ubiquinone/menaquinone biosynthesis C-methylase UbiE